VRLKYVSNVITLTLKINAMNGGHAGMRQKCRNFQRRRKYVHTYVSIVQILASRYGEVRLPCLPLSISLAVADFSQIAVDPGETQWTACEALEK
jgi:hypothetical protein